MTRRAVEPRRQRREQARQGRAAPVFGNANVLLYRQSVWLFAGFAVAMVVAFWPSYFSRLDAQPTYHAHAHGLAMTAWCVMLITQAWLIRAGKRTWHTRLGRVSFALVPVMVLATLDFLHFRLGGSLDLGVRELYMLSLILNALVAFLVLYGLALVYRGTPPVHGRYMLCTIFPLFTPITDRLIGNHARWMASMVPVVDGIRVVPVAGFLLADVLLAALSIWDWRSNRRLVFPVALAVLVVYHVSVLTFHRLPFWHSVGEWFVSLPLS